MAWKIIKVDGANYVAQADDRTVKARIMFVKGVWLATFPEASAFNWHQATAPDENAGLERCIGYVRGIERAAEVHHNETKESPSKAHRTIRALAG